MNNFELDEAAVDLLAQYTPYKIARELVITKENYDNLAWEYKQVCKELEELRDETLGALVGVEAEPEKPKNTFGSPATEQDAIDWAITMVDEGW